MLPLYGLSFLLFLATAAGYYVPGISPNEYEKGALLEGYSSKSSNALCLHLCVIPVQPA